LCDMYSRSGDISIRFTVKRLSPVGFRSSTRRTSNLQWVFDIFAQFSILSRAFPLSSAGFHVTCNRATTILRETMQKSG
jgi:hypothetical protein